MKLKEKLLKLLKMAVSLLGACIWHSTIESAVMSQQGQGQHLVSMEGGSRVQPKRRQNSFISHLRSILGKFSEVMFLMVFWYCLSVFPNSIVSNTVLHNVAQKNLLPCGKGVKLSSFVD